MAWTLGSRKKQDIQPASWGLSSVDRSPQRPHKPTYGSITSLPHPEPEQASPQQTYLSEKIPIPDAKPVGILGTVGDSQGCHSSLRSHKVGDRAFPVTMTSSSHSEQQCLFVIPAPCWMTPWLP